MDAKTKIRRAPHHRFAAPIAGGIRENLTLRLPVGETPAARYFLTTLLEDVSRIAGGYTLTRHEGGWINDTGNLEVEHGVTLNVSYIPDNVTRFTLLDLFAKVGRQLDQTEVHVERSAFTAQHMRLKARV